MQSIPTLAGLVFTAYIGWLVVRIVNRWSQPPIAPDKSQRPGLVWGVCVVPLLGAGFIVGYAGPVLLVIIASGPLTLGRTVWTAAVGLVISAIGTEWACSGLLRWWLRPLVWGLAIGAISSLVYLTLIGWNVDLTV
jgi:hypothetical protein